MITQYQYAIRKFQPLGTPHQPNPQTQPRSQWYSPDIDQGFEVWQKINKSQELNLPPYTYEFYKKYIVPIYEAKNADRDPKSKSVDDYIGVSRKEIIHRHFELEGSLPNDDILRRQILPMLEMQGW